MLFPLPDRAALSAFSRLELAAILAGAVALGLLAVPVLAGNRASTSRATCFNNLGRIGLAFRQWSTERSEEFPYAVNYPVGLRRQTSGLELNLWAQFSILSNDLASARALHCPADGSRIPANDFSLAAGGLLNANYRNNAISYFLGHPLAAEPRAILSGDRNLTGSTGFTTCSFFRTTPTFPASGSGVGWDAQLHNRRGHLLYNDGSVEAIDSAQLPAAFSSAAPASTEIHLLR